jgi:hypothetical protein
MEKADAGDTRKRLLTMSKTLRKFEINNNDISSTAQDTTALAECDFKWNTSVTSN